MGAFQRIVSAITGYRSPDRAERIREAVERRQAAYAARREAIGRNDSRAAHHAYKAFRAATADALRVEVGERAAQPRRASFAAKPASYRESSAR